MYHTSDRAVTVNDTCFKYTEIALFVTALDINSVLVCHACPLGIIKVTALISQKLFCYILRLTISCIAVIIIYLVRIISAVWINTVYLLLRYSCFLKFRNFAFTQRLLNFFLTCNFAHTQPCHQFIYKQFVFINRVSLGYLNIRYFCIIGSNFSCCSANGYIFFVVICIYRNGIYYTVYRHTILNGYSISVICNALIGYFSADSIIHPVNLYNISVTITYNILYRYLYCVRLVFICTNSNIIHSVVVNLIYIT